MRIYEFTNDTNKEMTKYILHGGNSSEANPDNDNFFRETTLGINGEVCVLLCYFARENSEVERCVQQDQEKFLRTSENKNLVFEVAEEDKFAEQLGRAQVLWLRGGKTRKLFESMSITDNLEKLFEGKVVAGSSAGVYVLVKNYWDNDTDKLGNGLGFLDLKAFCHYTPENKSKVDKLLEHGGGLPLITLPNCKWVVLFK